VAVAVVEAAAVLVHAVDCAVPVVVVHAVNRFRCPDRMRIVMRSISLQSRPTRFD
jgi:hypothetical protein